MCGIWGFVGSTETIDVRRAWDGLSSLTDRGPDDWGMYVDGAGKVTEENSLPQDERSVVLGNRRLSILDLTAAGNQPIGSEESGQWIVYNGEVYNYRELRSDLRESGHTFTSDTDTEVVLRAYQEYGEDCVHRLRGMFAFTIYDHEAGRLFGARDRFGIKPFYYCRPDGAFAFASEVTSLLAGGVAERELDPRGVDGFLTFGYVPGPNTILEGVRSLPAGSTITFDRETGRSSVERYWRPSFEDNRNPVPERIRTLLAESVEMRLRSDVPVAAFLSGGLDSSAIVALMRAVGGPDREDLHTFSIRFEQERFDEGRFAESVARELETQHTSRTVSAEDVEEQFDDVIQSMDQPSIDGVNTYFVSQLAADEGIKVVLSGLGSDELFYGYPSFDQIQSRCQKARLLYTLPRSLRRPIAGLVDRLDGVLGEGTAGKVADAIRSTSPFGASYITARGLFTNSQRRSLLGTDPEYDWAARLEEDLEETIRSAETRDAVSAAELSWYMNYQLLRDTDAMAMSHSLEVRVPFLDEQLAEYVMGATSESKAQGEKDLLKRSVAEDVPSTVLDRDKTGFTSPFAEWLDGELSSLVESTLSSSALGGTPISHSAADDVLDSYRAGNEHWSRVWALVVLSTWIDTHLES